MKFTFAKLLSAQSSMKSIKLSNVIRSQKRLTKLTKFKLTNSKNLRTKNTFNNHIFTAYKFENQGIHIGISRQLQKNIFCMLSHMSRAEISD